MFRTPRVFASLLLLLLPPLAAIGQSRPTAPPPSLNWVPQGFEVLGQRAAFHTDFTFDRSMLQLAGYFVGEGDPETRNAIAKLNGISVHSYHYAAPGLYDQAMLENIRRQFEATGWKHLVAAHGKGDPFDQGQTDLWINFAHMDVTGMMVLIQSPKDLNLVALSGDISTVDLLHLRGHFGIPRFPGDSFGKGPSERARPPYVPPPPAYPDSSAPADQAPQYETQQPAPQQYPGSVGVGVGNSSPEVQAAPPPPEPPGR